MSAAAMGNVWKYANYQGSKLVVLLAVADVVNDGYDNEFWMRSGKLAEKCNMHPGNVRRYLRALVDEGWLIELEIGGGHGKPSRYQFIFKEKEDTASTDAVVEQKETASYDTESASQCAHNRVIPRAEPRQGARHIYNSIETQTKPKELNGEKELFPAVIETEIELIDDKQLAKEMFGEFWDCYGRKLKRQQAEDFWNKHIGSVELARQVIDAAVIQKENTEPEYLPHPITWLRGKRWEDEVVSNKPLTAGQKTFMQVQGMMDRGEL